MPHRKIAQILKALVFLAICVACIRLYPHIDRESIGRLIPKDALAGPLAFILLCAFRPLLFFLPSMGLTILGGTLFGAVRGGMYVAAGGALSSIVGFYFAKWLGRDLLERLTGRNENLSIFLEKWSREKGVGAVFYMRLFNLPWDAVSYWAGLSGVSFRDFYLATLISLAPISFLYAYFGAHALDPQSPQFIVSLALIFAMGALPHIASKLKKKIPCQARSEP